MNNQENKESILKMASQYLPLTEYSTKHKVSISTLRRRIKADEIQFVFQDGKYLILDEDQTSHHQVHRPSHKSEMTEMAMTSVSRIPRKTSVAPPQGLSADSASSRSGSWNEEIQRLGDRDRQEPILSAANRLLTELKRAYTQILQEKEEQIVSLRSEVSDLKTLVKVLESDSTRKKNPYL